MMSSLITRIFGYVTLLSCLVVGTAAVRFITPSTTVIHLDSTYLNSFKSLTFSSAVKEELLQPEIVFAEIKLPVEKKVVSTSKLKQKPSQNKEPVAQEVILTVAKNELPFQETIKLKKVEFAPELMTNHVALFKGLPVNEEIATDEVKTSLAQASAEEDLDVMFFEYPTDKAAAPSVAEVVPENEKKSEVSVPKEESLENDLNAYASIESEEVALQGASPISEAMTTQALTTTNLRQIQAAEKATPSPEKAEEISLDQMITFDYSSAQRDITAGKIPKVSKLTSHKGEGKGKRKPSSRAPRNTPKTGTEKANLIVESNDEPEQEVSGSESLLPSSFDSKVVIQVTSTDFTQPEVEAGFQVRFQDDLSAMLEDYGSGSVSIEESLAGPQMTRSVTILKRGFAPTNNDLVIEAGESTLSLPIIAEDAFNKIMEPHGARGSIGAILVEMDDSTDEATIDVPFGEVITLDGDLKQTDKKDYRYKLFVGVRAGNTLLSYQTTDRQIVSKIVHVRENEVTFDANLYDGVDQVKVELKEEELLSREKSPLIIPASQVKIFATERSSKKVNDHTYSLDFGKGLLGGRQYLEVNHQAEPIFIGFKNNKEVSVPSENFMRHILSTVEGGSLQKHCVVQINLIKKIDKVFVAPESVNESVVAFTQMLDLDGKFYDSASSKTRKVIIVGQHQGSDDLSGDAKINVKLEYVDGSTEYVGSYCSPNTYLVEQL